MLWREDCESLTVEVRHGYEVLAKVLLDALDQAQWGKGAKRHGSGNVGREGAGLNDFQSQPLLEITARVGLGFPLGQAVKKVYESQQGGLDKLASRAELHGAIVYIAAAILYLEAEIPGEQV